MKERVVTFALALAAFALFYTLMAPKPSAPQERVTRPISIEAGPNGHAALFRWLEAERVPVASFRERYTELSRRFAPSSATGHLLITATPHDYPIRASEVEPLRAWIAAGNTLLVLAGLSDTPEWSMAEGYDVAFMQNMESMTGLRFVAIEVEADAAESAEAAEEEGESAASPSMSPALAAMRLDEPQEFTLVPNGLHAFFSGVESAVAVSEYPASKWRAYSVSSPLLLELAHEAESGSPVLWELRQGEGRILVTGYGSLFTNKLLGRADNARLLANIVRETLGPHGSVILDDAHQGLVAFYDPDAFFGDARLHRSLGWLVALWFVFVLGAQRLRPLASTWSPLDITSFVRATGGFMARVLKPAAAGQRLFANFFNDVRRQIGLPADGGPVWEWLDAHSSMDTREIARLAALHARTMSGHRVDLVKLHNALVRARESLN